MLSIFKKQGVKMETRDSTGTRQYATADFRDCCDKPSGFLTVGTSFSHYHIFQHSPHTMEFAHYLQNNSITVQFGWGNETI